MHADVKPQKYKKNGAIFIGIKKRIMDGIMCMKEKVIINAQELIEKILYL